MSAALYGGWDHKYFLMRGLPNVEAEMSLSVLAYNVTRVINIIGVKKLIEACSTQLHPAASPPAWGQ